MDTFEQAIAFTLRPDVEGGYSDVPGDNGGATMCGITQATYSAWLKEKSMPDAAVSQISPQEIHQIYKDEYWDSAKLDEFVAAGCSPKVAIAVFDCGVNVGVGRSVKLLQATLDCQTDGIMGHDTMNAALTYPKPDLLTALLSRRRSYYCALAKQNKADEKFLDGWLARVDHLATYLRGLA